MFPNFSNYDSLIRYVNKENLYAKLLTQIEKDFVLANIEIDISVSILPMDLKVTLNEKIYQLILEKFDEYLNLLYIIDVSESSFKEIKVTDVVEVAEEVSFLILKREAQKVWLKSKYSG